MSNAPDDKKNLFRKNFPRFAFQSGQKSIHGDTNFQVQTQEAQSLSFHASTGEMVHQRWALEQVKQFCTRRIFNRSSWRGLKVRDAGDVVQLPAKIIKCKRGDTIIECENGDITLRGRNINIDATGGGQDGIVNINGNRIIDLDSPDIRLQGEKITDRW